MKQCEYYRDLIPLYLGNDLSDEDMKIVKAHIESCEQCAKFAKNVEFIESSIAGEQPGIDKSYGAELVVNINDRIEKRRRNQKRFLVGSPVFASILLAVALIFIFKVDNASKSFISDINDTEVLLRMMNSGFLSEITYLDDVDDRISDLEATDANIIQGTIELVLEEDQAYPINSYLLATGNLNDSDFEKLVEEVYNSIL